MITHSELLKKLLGMQGNVIFFAQELQQYPWDVAQPLAVLTRDMIAQVLERFLLHEFDANALEQWANLITGREDIAFERGYEHAINEAIFQLANPLRTETITEKNVRSLLVGLQ